MKNIFFASFVIIISTSLFAQPNLEWESNLGGSSNEEATYIQQTTDGGYIVAGNSVSNDGDVGGNHGNIGKKDFWIVKLNTTGNLVWETNLGGFQEDYASSILQTTNGDYIVAGSSGSNDGDVGGNNGGLDYWVVKLDPNGNIIWENNFGGSNNDMANSIQITTDGGYIIAGQSHSNDGDVGGNNGGFDYWIVKLDANGILLWENNFGGSVNEYPNDIQQTTDGGFIVAGQTNSNNGDVGGQNGNGDFWIIKLDVSGNLEWETNLGGVLHDVPYSVLQTLDDGYIAVGGSWSNDGDVGGNNGFDDIWIVKLDTNGNLIWESNLGGSDVDIAYSIQHTIDDGYIIAGESSSIDGDVGGNNNNSPGTPDYWVVKLDVNGNLVWENNFGGTHEDKAFFIQQTTNGGYIVAGYTYSNDGDVGENNGYKDYWIVKLDADLSVGDYLIDHNISLYPNPTATTFTIANFSEEINKVEILDLQGRVILSTSEIHNNNVDVSKLQTAMYIVKIYASTNVFTQQIIKN